MKKNPRFTDEAFGPLREPDIDQIVCMDSVWRADDQFDGKVKGAIIGICKVYSNKPYGITWNNDPCPYYASEDD